PELRCRLLDRFHDVDVARASAQVPGDPLPDLRLGGIRALAQEPGGLPDHPRGAEAALEAVLVPEGLLERVELSALLHALDSHDLGAVGLDRQDRARLRAPAVHVDRARAAVAGIAPGVRAGELEHV